MSTVSPALSPRSEPHRHLLQRKVLQDTEGRQRARREQEEETARSKCRELFSAGPAGAASRNQMKPASSPGAISTRTAPTTAFLSPRTTAIAGGAAAAAAAPVAAVLASSSPSPHTGAGRRATAPPDIPAVSSADPGAAAAAAPATDAIRTITTTTSGGGLSPSTVCVNVASNLANVRCAGKPKAKLLLPVPHDMAEGREERRTGPHASGGGPLGKVQRTSTPARKGKSTTAATGGDDWHATTGMTTRSGKDTMITRGGGPGEWDCLPPDNNNSNNNSTSTCTSVPAGLTVLSLHQANTALQQQMLRLQHQLVDTQTELVSAKQHHSQRESAYEEEIRRLKQSRKEQQQQLRQHQFTMERIQQRELRRSQTPSPAPVRLSNNSSSTAHSSGQAGGTLMSSTDGALSTVSGDTFVQLQARQEVEEKEEQCAALQEQVRRLTEELETERSEWKSANTKLEQDLCAARAEQARLEQLTRQQREAFEELVRSWEEKYRQATTPPPLLLRAKRSPKVTFQLENDEAAQQLRADMRQMRKEYEMMEWHTVWLEKETTTLREQMMKRQPADPSSNAVEQKEAEGAAAAAAAKQKKELEELHTLVRSANHKIRELEEEAQRLRTALEASETRCATTASVLEKTTTKTEKLLKVVQEREAELTCCRDEVAALQNSKDEAEAAAKAAESSHRVELRRLRRETEKMCREAFEKELAEAVEKGGAKDAAAQRAKADDLALRLADAQEQLTTSETTLAALREELELAQRSLVKAEAARHRAEEALAGQQEAARLAQDQCDALTTELAEVRAAVDRLQRDHDTAVTAHRELLAASETRSEDVSNRAAALSAELAQLRSELAAKEAAAAQQTAEGVDLTARLAEREAALQAVEEERTAMRAAEARYQQTCDQLQAQLKEAEAERKAALQAAADDAAAKTAALVAQIDQLEGQLQHTTAELGAVQQRQEEEATGRVADHLQQRVDELEEALCAMEAQRSAAQAAQEAAEKELGRVKTTSTAELGLLRRQLKAREEAAAVDGPQTQELEEAVCLLQEQILAYEGKVRRLEMRLQARTIAVDRASTPTPQPSSRAASPYRTGVSHVAPLEAPAGGEQIAVSANNSAREPPLGRTTAPRLPLDPVALDSGAAQDEAAALRVNSTARPHPTPAAADYLQTPRRGGSPSSSPSRPAAARRARSPTSPHRLDPRFFDPTVAAASQQTSEIGGGAAGGLNCSTSLLSCGGLTPSTVGSGVAASHRPHVPQRPTPSTPVPPELQAQLHGSPEDLTFLQISARFLLLGKNGKRLERPFALQLPNECSPALLLNNSESRQRAAAGRSSGSALGSISHVVWGSRWAAQASAWGTGGGGAAAQSAVFVFAVRISWLPSEGLEAISEAVQQQQRARSSSPARRHHSPAAGCSSSRALQQPSPPSPLSSTPSESWSTNGPGPAPGRREVLIGFAERGLPLERYTEETQTQQKRAASTAGSPLQNSQGGGGFVFHLGKWRTPAEAEAMQRQSSAHGASASSSADEEEEHAAAAWNSRRAYQPQHRDVACYYYNIQNRALYAPIQNIRRAPLRTPSSAGAADAEAMSSTVVQCALHSREKCITYTVFEEYPLAAGAEGLTASTPASSSASASSPCGQRGSSGTRWIEVCRDVVGFRSVDVTRPLFPAVEVNSQGAVVELI